MTGYGGIPETYWQSRGGNVLFKYGENTKKKVDFIENTKKPKI